MTRAFFPETLYKKRVFEFLDVAVASQLGDKARAQDAVRRFFPYSGDERAKVMFRFVRLFASDMVKVRKNFTLAFETCRIPWKEEYFKNIPVTTLAKEIDSLKIFPNLTVTETNPEIMKDCSGIIHGQEALSGLLATYKEELKGAASKRWESVARTIKTLKRNETITTARYMGRFMPNIKACLTDAHIRDVAASFDELRKPLELHFADTHKDMVYMYSEGPNSCMSWRGADERGWGWMTKMNLHPCSLFVHHPYIRGAYIKQAGKVAARAFLYQYHNGEWKAGRIFSATGRVTEIFRQLLIEHKIKEMHDKHFLRDVTFKVPGTQHAGTYIMPLPYCDNLHENLSVSYNKETHEFTVTCGTGITNNVHIKGTAGYVTAEGLAKLKCAACGTIIRAGQRAITARDGTAFCSTDHAKHLGYVHAYRSDGGSDWVRREQAIPDALDRNAFFTTRDAAYAVGAFQVMNEINDTEEDEPVSLAGTKVYLDGTHYRYVGSSEYLGPYNKMGADGSLIIPCIANNISFKIKEQKIVEIEEGFSPFMEIAA